MRDIRLNPHFVTLSGTKGLIDQIETVSVQEIKRKILRAAQNDK